MNLKFTCLPLLFICLSTTLFAQTSKDVTLPVTASISTNPAGITLQWPNPNAATITVRRRTKGQAGNQWMQLLNATNSTETTLVDNTVVTGQIYEYFVSRATNVVAIGFAHVALEAPVTDSRGKVLVFIDSTTADALGVELVRMKNDMRSDGWIATPYKTGPSSTPQSVKNQIIAAYNADPSQVKAVFLIGRVPVPYSGNSNWDGHADHAGAWPCDNYYADLNGTWTDVSVNNITPARDANDNVPGDGKFDQSFMPSAAELQVGRLDFRHLNPALFGASEIELLRRYLNKDHAWRTGAYTVANKALVDDNFGYFNGEAFAANGYRNAYPLVGDANVIAGDFFGDSDDQKWLLGYGTGGGSYTSASGVGNSTDFATKTVNIVFSNIFGSYHGDWDYESNPLMPSALASQGGLLTCGWAGRPTWYMQALASGESIGYCMQETQNAQYNANYTGSSGRSGAHVSLLGDPTLRAHIVPPVTAISLATACTNVSVNWTPSVEATNSGYHVYRSFSNDGPYTRLTANLLTTPSFVDLNPPQDTLYYQVRAIRPETTPGGGTYLNNSTSPIQSIIFALTQPVPVAVATSTVITCNNPSATLQAADAGAGATYGWSGPNGFTAAQQTTTTTLPGNYTLIVTGANGCSNSTTFAVVQDTDLPVVAIPPAVITCTNTSPLFSTPNIPGLRFYYSGILLTPGQQIPVTQAGGYKLVLESIATGCTREIDLVIIFNGTIPTASATGGELTCMNQSVTLQGTSSANTLFQWTGPGGFFSEQPNPSVSLPGTYTFQVTDPTNGCTSVVTVVVTDATGLPIVVSGTVVNESTAGANNGSIDLSASGGTGILTYAWNNGVNTQDVANLSAGTYTVTVTDQNGCAEVLSVVVQTLVSTVEADLFRQFQLSPNPTTGPVMLTFTLNRIMQTEISVCNALGQVIWQQAATPLRTATIPIDLSGQAPGIYSIRMLLDGVWVVRQVSVLR